MEGGEPNVLATSEAKLAESERFRALTERLGIGLFEATLDGRYLYASAELLRMLDIADPAELAALSAPALYVDPGERDRLLALLHRDGSVRDHEVRWRRRDGSARWLALSAVLAERGGEPTVFGSVVDIDRRKRAEQALRESEERWRTIVDSEPECVKVLDREGRLLEMNAAGLAMIQASAEQAIGRRANALVAPEDRPAFDAMVAAVFRGETRHLVFDMIGLRGRRLTLESTSVPLRDPATGEVTACIGLTRDISERRRAEEALRRSERLLREAQALGRMGSYEYDFAADAWTSSAVLDDIFGIDGAFRRDLNGWLSLVHPDERDGLAMYLAWTVQERARFAKDYRIVRPADGSIRWVHGTGVIEYDERRAPRRLVGTILDVTDRRRDDEQLRRAAAVFRSSREGFAVTDDAGEIEEVNDAFTAITGWQRGEAVGHNLRFLQADPTDSLVFQEVWQRLRESGQWQGEIASRRRDGSTFPAWLSLSTVRGEGAHVAGYVAVLSDISTLKETEEKLEHLARHDVLTDLPNRLLLGHELDAAIARALRDGSGGAVLLLDLDRFKNVNDSLGHAAGDEILRDSARLLRRRLRDRDFVARLGGDEFVVVLENVGREQAAGVARDLIERFRQPFAAHGREMYVGLSVGIGLFPADGDRAEVLLQNADAALYAAKEGGRSTWRFYSQALTTAANERLALEAELRRGLELGEFLLHFQPVVRLADGRVESVEALLRWQSPTRGLVLPARFIPVAEDTGLIGALGEEALRQACAHMRRWHDLGLPLARVAVNVSPRQFLSPDLERRTAAILAASGLDARHLELEITESAVMGQGAQAEGRLAALRALGLRLTVDDFGTGYSSLSHLRRFPIDTLKVDRSFVAGLADDRAQREIVLTVLALARQLELHVVAEGVETPAQAEFLRDHGCDSAQGYLLGRPMPPEELEAWLRRGGAVPEREAEEVVSRPAEDAPPLPADGEPSAAAG